MKRPLQILQTQITAYLHRASASEAKNIHLTKPELESLRINFNQLCYEISFGQLDEVYQKLINDPAHQSGIFQEQDLNNILIILETIKAAE